MIRKLIPLAIAIILVVGCSKKKSEDGGGDAPGGGSDSGAAYTIKLREEQAGDKVTIVGTKRISTNFKQTGVPKPANKSSKGTMKNEYTENVLEKPAGAVRATKATRAYKTAEKQQDGGPARPASYANKTVLIEKRGNTYSFTVGGVPLVGEEDAMFRERYEKADGMKPEDVTPKKAVRVNEQWDLDAAVVKRFSNLLKLPVVADKSTATGRLLKAYSKNGQQWGTLEIKIDVAAEGKNGNVPLTGTVPVVMTVDAAIDGSSLDLAAKTKATVKISSKPIPDVEIENVVEFDEDETRTTVK